VLHEDKGRSFKHIEVSAHKGYLTAFASFRQVDNYFAAEYCDPDTRAGMTGYNAKVTYTMDDLPPFSVLRSLSPEFAAFVRNTNMMVECDIGKSTSDDYSRESYTVDIKNDESLALYNYHFWYKYNYEGNAGGTMTPTNKISGFTKILLFDLLTFRVLGRVENTQGTVFAGDVDGYTRKPYLQLTGFIEASLKPARDITLTCSYKGQTNRYAKHNNWFAKAEVNLYGAVALGLTYGEPPLTGYWLDDDSNDTQNVYMATLKGRF
jgi:hypothetical protein